MVGEAKLLRATLVFASGSPLGASAPALMPAAVSIELLHLASLVHDDIIDEATERRGVPALHVATGRNRALVVGDLLIVAAYDMLARARTDDIGERLRSIRRGAEQRRPAVLPRAARRARSASSRGLGGRSTSTSLRRRRARSSPPRRLSGR